MKLLSEPLFWASGICVLITGLVVVVDVAWRAKASMRASLTSSIVPYLLLMIFGNVVSTVLGSIAITSKLPEIALAWLPLLAPFFGVFAFEGIISNTNVSIFGKGVLSFQDWLGKARDPAVASAVKKEVQIGHDQMIKTTDYLRNSLSDEHLNTYLASWCGAETVASTEASARASGADIKLSKALELATNEPDKAIALVKQLRKQSKN